MTISALFCIPKLVASVPGSRKSEVVQPTLEVLFTTARPIDLRHTE
jgi:hypothetical protein